MLAILSDIHGNLEALQAVLADARGQGATEFVCLGDVVGYGPNPVECLDHIMTFRLVIEGNHDNGALFDPQCFSPIAERAIFWTRGRLEDVSCPREQRHKRWEFLAERPRIHKEGQHLFVHGSARNPLNEYVFPEDVYNQRKMENIFARVERTCFQGHTHVPGIFIEEESSDRYSFSSPEEIDFTYPLDDRKTLINVGSVGQPRDGNWRSCYVLLGEDRLTYRRVEYDVDSTVRKIHAIADLDRQLGDRLRVGQ